MFASLNSRLAVVAVAGAALLTAGCFDKKKDVKQAQTTAPTQTQQTVPPVATVPKPQTPPQQTVQVLRSGKLNGVGSYRAQGDIQIVKVGNVTKIVLSQNFTFSGAPDPKLGFGSNGYKRGTNFAKLNKNNGTQEYVLPAGFDLAKHNEVWIWCERFNVALAVAKLG